MDSHQWEQSERRSSRIKLWIATCVSALMFTPAVALALEISFGQTTPRGCQLAKPALVLSGEIIPGDYDRLVDWIRANPDVFLRGDLSVVPDSSGGSISEAIKIAELLERSLAGVWLAASCENPPFCGSACFALVVGAPRRIILPMTVALHRPYFSATAYRAMDVHSARGQYEEMVAAFKDWLVRRHVPSTLVEAMMTKSSREMYWLTEDDVRALGDAAPWFEELVIARCNVQKDVHLDWAEAARKGDKERADRLLRTWNSQAACVTQLTNKHRRALLSPGGGL